MKNGRISCIASHDKRKKKKIPYYFHNIDFIHNERYKSNLLIRKEMSKHEKKIKAKSNLK